MPAGKGKPALGYHAGKKGSHGCKGYPTVSADGTVHGCHPTKAQAAAQARAIWASVESKKFVDSLNLVKSDNYFVVEGHPLCDGFAVLDSEGELEACFATKEKADEWIITDLEEDMQEESDIGMSTDAYDNSIGKSLWGGKFDPTQLNK